MQDIKNIGVIGHLSIDDIKTSTDVYKGVLGGAAVYSSLAVSSNGNYAHMISTSCEDFDLATLQEKANERVNTQDVLHILGKQRRAFMEYTKEFSRTSHNHARLEWLQDTIKQCPRHIPRLINYDGVMLVPMLPEVQKQYVAWFRKHTKSVICLDTSEYFAENNREEIKQLIKLADIFIPSDVELDLLFPEHNGDLYLHIDMLRYFGIKIAVIKRSTKGSILISDDGIYSCNIRSTEAKDTTGAGDSFAGSFLSMYLSSKDLIKSLKYATIVSSFCVEQVGFDGLIHLDSKRIADEMEKLQINREMRLL